MTAKELIAAAADPKIPFMSWRAKATEFLGEGAPSTKDEILAALEKRAAAEHPKAPEPEPVKVPEDGLEVELRVRSYAPRYLMQEDGSWKDQHDPTGRTVLTKIGGGKVVLHRDDAQQVLRDGRAVPTAATFAKLG